MNSIRKALAGSTLQNVLISAVIAGIFVFAVLPALPNVTDGKGISLSALTTLADSDGGGDGGDGGSDGGGDGGDSSTDGGGDAGTGLDTGGSDTSGVGSGDSTSIVAPRLCVLQITKSVNKTTASVGETITYTLDFKNTGTADCTGGGVRVVDPLPTHVQYVSETHSSDVAPGYGSMSVYDASTHTVYFNARTLTPGESGFATITVKVKEPASCGNFSFENKAKITAAELNNFSTWVYSAPVRTDVTNACQAPAPVCAFAVSPPAITTGQSATLSWSTSNATNVSINQNIGAVTLSGNRVITPATTSTYTLTALGDGGTVTCTQTIVVTPVAIPLPQCTLEAVPTSITRGGSSTLSWTTTNAATVRINTGIGSVTVSGSRSVSPTTTTTYTLTAENVAGGVECIRTITVNDPEPGPLSCDALTAAPGTLTEAGTTTLSWATTNATNVSIDNGVGTVSEDGSKAVRVNAHTTFTLTATRGAETKTCTVPVTIVPNVVVPRCDAFTVSPSSLRSGAQATLSWQTTNATNVSINQGVGSVALDGSQNLVVNADTVYTLTAGNGLGTTSCQASVSIETGGGGGGGGGSNSPRCSLKASDTSIKAGEKVTLTWKNAHTNDVLLKDNRGNVIADSKKDSKIDEDADSIDVRPAKSTTYTLTALKSTKKDTCTVDITVQGVTVTSTRTVDPLVAGISLSRLPYTGFDAGPFLTSVFYTLLVLWALAVAYFLVIRRESVLGVSLKTRTTDGKKAVYSAPITEPSAILPSSSTPHMTAPEVSRMTFMPSAFAKPRALPHGDMASKHAPVGYEALYGDYGGTHSEETVTETQNLPVASEVIVTDDTELLETRAHDARVLISTDALNFIMAQTKITGERVELLDSIVATAKAQFPTEDGWIAVNKERILELLK